MMLLTAQTASVAAPVRPCIVELKGKAATDRGLGMLQVLPHVFSALEANARSHWNPAVHGLTCNVRKMFQEMDEELYEECRQQYEKDEVARPLGCRHRAGTARERLCGRADRDVF